MSCFCWQIHEAEYKFCIRERGRAPGDEDDFTIWTVDVSIMAFIMTRVYFARTQKFHRVAALDWSLKTEFYEHVHIKDSWDVKTIFEELEIKNSANKSYADCLA